MPPVMPRVVRNLPDPDTWQCFLGPEGVGCAGGRVKPCALISDCTGSDVLSWGDTAVVLPLLLLGLGLPLFSLSSFLQGTSMSFRQEPDSSCINIQAEINSASGGVTLP